MKIKITESQLKVIEQQLSKEQYLKQYFSNDSDTITEYVNDSGVFNIEELTNINSFSGRVNYCKKSLKQLGSGSSRVVFQLSNDKVVKLAKNSQGIAQNEVEGDSSYNDYSILAIGFGHDDYYLYNIMELAKPLKTSSFKSITGIDFKDITNYYGIRANNSIDFRVKYFARLYEKYGDNNNFLYSLETYVGDTDMPLGDLMKKSSYGEVTRDGHPTIVLIDYGLSEESSKAYYK